MEYYIDPMQSAIDILCEFGVTRTEALVYCALLEGQPANGYEIAKSTGLSRSNVYTSLSSLATKGLARFEEGDSTRYFAVECEEYVRNRLRLLRELGSLLPSLLPRPRQDNGGYLTIEGAQNILDTLHTLIDRAQLRLYAVLRGGALQALLPALEVASARGLKVVLLTPDPVEIPGAKVYHASVPAGQVRLIADSSWVLTGEWSRDKPCSALYSNKSHLVELFKDAIRNEIKLLR